MTVLVSEVYEALRQAGIEDDTAKAAAKSVLAVEEKETLATKADLAELKADIIKWNMALMIAMTGLFAAIVKIF